LRAIGGVASALPPCVRRRLSECLRRLRPAGARGDVLFRAGHRIERQLGTGSPRCRRAAVRSLRRRRHLRGAAHGAHLHARGRRELSRAQPPPRARPPRAASLGTAIARAAARAICRRAVTITFVLPFLNLTGGVRVVVDFANWLHDRGHAVTIVYPTWPY